ncbi:MAG: SDR family oxidoreductase [Actinomycetota bacterium]|nr:SDR family oxidoreductase [Actinomycetota bacterium]
MILVTGATGTVGGHLLAQLDLAGTPVRALVRTPEKADVLKGYDAEVAVGDLARPETLRAALAGVDRVFLLSPPSPDQPALEKSLIDAAAASGRPHVVKLASIGFRADGEVIGRNHAEVVDHLKASGLPYTVLAPNFFMQNLLLSASTIQEQGALFQSAGDGAAAHVDARDVAAVAAHVLTSEGHEGAVYPVTGPAALTFDEVAATFSRVLGREVRHVDVPVEQARQAMVAGGMDDWLANAMAGLSEIYREGSAAEVSDEVEKATGSPARSLEAFVRDHRGAFG